MNNKEKIRAVDPIYYLIEKIKEAVDINLTFKHLKKILLQRRHIAKFYGDKSEIVDYIRYCNETIKKLLYLE